MGQENRAAYVVPGLVGRRGRGEAANRRRFAFPAAALALLGAFLAAPWPFAHKAHLALHGLCAQRPSHSLYLGGEALPLDARMTGIYGGFLVTAGFLAARGRLRAFRLPPARVTALLALFVVAMAADGANSLLLDLGLAHPYTPDNRLRVATGLLTGVALATVLGFIVATTLWRQGDWHQAPIGGLRELAAVVALQLPLAAAVSSGEGSLYRPLAIVLLVSAVAVVGTLALVVLVLFGRRDRTYASGGQLQGLLTGALLLAVTLMAGFAAVRMLLERLVGAPPLT